MNYGATRDDLRRRFAHSSLEMTECYVHERGTNLEKVAKIIQLFPECSMNVPRNPILEHQVGNQVPQTLNNASLSKTGA